MRTAAVRDCPEDRAGRGRWRFPAEPGGARYGRPGGGDTAIGGTPTGCAPSATAGAGSRDAGPTHRTGPRRAGEDEGQVTIEFLGMTPLILITLVLLWQFVLLGYTYSLAGNAADEAARAGTAVPAGQRQAACQEAGTDKLPGAWSGTVSCATGGGYVKATVTLQVPVLFPGSIGFPFDVEGHAGAVEEDKD